jgi:parallel beta-helix repeat protein
VNETGWWRDSGAFNANGTPVQAAVDNATAGETICVRDGTYSENVDVDVAHLTIRSEHGSANCIVNAASSSDHVFEVTVDYVNISGFTVENATGRENAGILLGSNVDHCNISANTASNNCYGIFLWTSSNNTLTNNTANSNSNYGICLGSSSNNALTENTANSNSRYGIYLNNADDNNVSCNWVQNNTDAGLYLTNGSTDNTIGSNNIIANGVVQGDGSYRWQFANNQSDDVNIAGNWWGTANTTRINASISDWTYDTGWGNVTTSPKLDGPAPCAPIPELPTVLLLAVGLLMLAGYVRAGRRK